MDIAPQTLPRPSPALAPQRPRQGNPSETLVYALASSTIGLVLAAWSDRGVCAILLGDDPSHLTADLQARFPSARLVESAADLDRLTSKVVAFIDAPKHGLDLALDMRGTDFQRRVWTALQNVPPGQTVSYLELADRAGCPRSTRAVANACAANAIAVAIPCHRAIRSDGALSGYRWGVERKRRLLENERT